MANWFVPLFAEALNDEEVEWLRDDEFRVWVKAMLYAVTDRVAETRGEFVPDDAMIAAVAGGDRELFFRSVRVFVERNFVVIDGDGQYRFRAMQDRLDRARDVMVEESRQIADEASALKAELRRERNREKVAASRQVLREQGGKPNAHLRHRTMIEKRDGLACAFCGARGKELVLQHLIPTIRGGGDEPENLVLACKRCNVRKGDRTPDEFETPLRTKFLDLWRSCKVLYTADSPIPPIPLALSHSVARLPLHTDTHDVAPIPLHPDFPAVEPKNGPAGGSGGLVLIPEGDTNVVVSKTSLGRRHDLDRISTTTTVPINSSHADRDTTKEITDPPCATAIVTLLRSRPGMRPMPDREFVRDVQQVLDAYPTVDALRVTRAYVGAQLSAAPSVVRWRKWMQNESDRIAANTTMHESLPDDDAVAYKVAALDFSRED